MNQIENSMVKTLIRLKEEFGASCIKMSFETENLGTYELLKVKEIASKAGLGLLMKLGGCEALTDIEIAKTSGAQIILGPMIESKFALQKYLQMCEKVFKGDDNVKFMINIETIESCDKIDDILNANNVRLLESVVVGRTDLCSSMGISDVNCDETLRVVKDLFKKTKGRGIKCVLGGGISPNALDFFEGLGDLLDGFETRKVVFENVDSAKKNLEECLKLALEFELGWYQLKKEYYLNRCNEDNKKIEQMLVALGQN